jgi:hypothetical protein
VPLGPRLFGTAFLPLLAGALTIAFNTLFVGWVQGSALPGLTHGATLGSLVLVGG